MGEGGKSCRAPLLHYCTTALLHYCTTALLHDCTTAILHYCTTALLHYCSTALLHYCTTALLHYCAAVRRAVRVPVGGIFAIRSHAIRQEDVIFLSQHLFAGDG